MGLFNWFKSKGEEGEVAPEDSAPTPPPAPARVLKTVSPNTMKPLNLREGTPRIGSQLGVPSGFSLAAQPVATMEDEAPSPGQPERDIYLDIGDFVDRIPREYLGNYQPHLKRRISFRLGDIFADLSKGRATIPLQTLYHFCPDIFNQPCTDGDPIPISLPLQKLVEQVGMFEGRQDQIQPEQYTQIDTPIARVAAEDGGAPIPVVARGSAAAQPSAMRPPPPPAPARMQQAAAMPPPPPAPAQAIALPKIAPPPAPPLITPPAMAPLPALQPIPVPAIPLPTQSQLTPPAAMPPQPQVLRPVTQLPSAPIAPVGQALVAGRPGGALVPGAKRPPATVRASFAGGKITLRASVPPQRASGPASSLIPGPVAGNVPVAARAEADPGQGTGAPIPSSMTQPSPATAIPPKQQKKITGRIQIPPLRLQGDPSLKQTLVSDASEGQAPFGAPYAPPNVPLPSAAPPRVLESPAQPSAGAGQLAFAAQTRAAAPSGSSTNISLGLANIIRSLPADVLGEMPPAIPDQVRVSLPFELIEPQLAEGRVVIPGEMLLGAVTSEMRSALSSLDPNATVALPLQEIFQNLPDNTLSMRRDQVMDRLTEEYDTPFLAKMREDEVRFSTDAAPQPRSAAASPASVPMPSDTEIGEIGRLKLGSKATQPLPPDLRSPAPAPPPRSAPERSPERSVAASLPPPSIPRVARSQEVPVAQAPMMPAAARASETESTAEPAKTQKIPMEELSRAPERPHSPPAKPVEAPRPVAAEAVPKPSASAPPRAVAQPKPIAQPKAIAQPAAKPVVAEAKAPSESRSSVERSKEVAQSGSGAGKSVSKPSPLIPYSGIPRTPVISPHIATAKAVRDEDEVDVSELQALFMTEEHLDAKNIVKHTSRLPGISGCLLMFADGLPIAGNLPEGFSQDAFGAIIPRFMGKVTEYSRDLRLGLIETVTLHTDKGPVSLFMHEQVCMALLHSKSRFLPGVREKLALVVREVSRMYGPGAGH